MTAPKTAARRARQEWNRGMTGDSKASRAISSPGGAPCTTAGCGDPCAPRGRARAGMVRIPAHGDEPPRAYCVGWCATYAQALADIRGIP